jgi:hypothetical protein
MAVQHRALDTAPLHAYCHIDSRLPVAPHAVPRDNPSRKFSGSIDSDSLTEQPLLQRIIITVSGGTSCYLTWARRSFGSTFLVLQIGS